MDTFVFINHPIDPKRDVSRKFPLLGRLLTLKEHTVYRKRIQTGRMAERLGAKLLGLGAFTPVVGDSGITAAEKLDIPVTTGDSYTIAVAVKSLLGAAAQMRISLYSAGAAVVGAVGAIGRTCASFLAHKVVTLYLFGRPGSRLADLVRQISAENAAVRLVPTTDLSVIQHARMVLTVTSNVSAIIEPEDLLPGSVGDVPGLVGFNSDFWFPAGKAYACMTEKIARTLEGRFEDHTLGKQISRHQAEEIDTIAAKHGFNLSRFRCFEKTLTQTQIKETWLRAQAAQQLP